MKEASWYLEKHKRKVYKHIKKLNKKRKGFWDWFWEKLK